MRTAIYFSVLIAIFASNSNAAAQNHPNTAVVDIQRALTQVEAGRQALATLQVQLEERQVSLDRAEAHLRSLSENLEQELVLMNTESRRQAIADFQRQLRAYQEAYMSNQQELMLMEQAATQDIVLQMAEIVQEIAEERNLTVVFERRHSGVLWAAEGVDITDLLISRYEQRY